MIVVCLIYDSSKASRIFQDVRFFTDAGILKTQGRHHRGDHRQHRQVLYKVKKK